MKIVGSPTSPYVRKVRITAMEKHLEAEFVLGDLWAADHPVAELNPLEKIPVLVLDDGVVYDSRVIVEYLDGRAPTHRLIPEGNRDRTAVRVIEALADGICDAAVAIVLEKKFHGDASSAAWIERQEGKIQRAVAALGQALGKDTWMHGKNFSLADIACGCALGFLDLRFPHLDWRKTSPNLTDYFNKLSERPSFQSTQPPQ